MFKIIKLAYISVAILLALSSCSQGGEPAMPDGDTAIKFTTALGSAQRSRSYEVNDDNFSKFNVTSFYSGMDSDPDGTLKPYFSNVTFEKKDDGFVSLHALTLWPWEDEDYLKFLAYYPTTLSFTNQTKSIDNIVYRIGTFTVDPEISNHVDFVAAYKESAKCKTVHLDFKHQLSRVELQAKSQNKKYNFDIAGVRIGSQVSTATYDFVSDSDHPGLWSNVAIAKGGVSHTYLDTAKIVTLIDDPEPKPIMIDGGPAMVVPIAEKAWDPEKEWGSEGVGRMYFSILLRVTRKDGGSVFYPYQKGEHKGLRVYEVVDKNGNTLKDKNGQPLVFGWAAVPVGVNWVAGNRYVYTMNFTDGVGRHDPEDPEPGHIIDSDSEGGNFGVSLSVEKWNNAPLGSYNPDITVPYE